ncbi:hypothetical protein GCM10020254_59710 [Streptomyces goshikiensis]
MDEPKRYSQYANMFSRGNATSGAPICSGMIQFAKPANSGVANISSMIVPCMVKAWLNCSFDMICVPGRASSARMKSARRPPMRKNTNDVTRYIVPMVLWSVVVIHFTTTLPGCLRRTGSSFSYESAAAPWDSLRMLTVCSLPHSGPGRSA